jgi:uncharacterized protein (DUF58 family)
MTASIRQRAEQLASVLPPLLVAAERVASTVVQGVHGRRQTGQGEAFWQFRRYQPGDSISRIDWRQSGRTQAVFVRENEWEAAQSVWLWRDASASMRYGSTRNAPTKKERADLLLLAAAAMLLRGGERVALLGRATPPANSRAVLTRLAAELDDHTDPPGSLPPAIDLPRHSRLVLTGDFLTPLDQIERVLETYAARGVSGHLVQVLDPAELALPFAGRVLFEGMEGEGNMLARRVEQLRDEYRGRIDTHCAELAELARRVGWTCRLSPTTQSPEAALMALYVALAGPRAT